MHQILIVEDDPFIVDIYAIQLKKDGYKVSVAKDGQMALDKINESIPDLLVLDLNLPKIDGWEVLRMLRQEPATKDLKVIILSNNFPQNHTQDVEYLKVIKYFVKIETSVQEISHFIKEILK